MADHLVNIVVTAEIQTTKSVRNFRVELSDLDSVFRLVERLANWLNDEVGTDVVVKSSEEE